MVHGTKSWDWEMPGRRWENQQYHNAKNTGVGVKSPNSWPCSARRRKRTPVALWLHTRKANVDTNRGGRSSEPARLLLVNRILDPKLHESIDSFGGLLSAGIFRGGDWAKAEHTPGKPTTLSMWRPASQHAPETRESSPEPISDQLPKNTFAYPIFPSMSPNSRRLRPWREVQSRHRTRRCTPTHKVLEWEEEWKNKVQMPSQQWERGKLDIWYEIEVLKWPGLYF